LYAHDLRYGSGHLGGQSRCECTQAVFIGCVAEQPVAKATDSEVADRSEGQRVMAVDYQPSDFIGLVRDQHFLQEIRERDVSQRHLRGDPFTVVQRGHACQKVPGTRRAGLGHYVFEAVETVGLGTNRMRESCHSGFSITPDAARLAGFSAVSARLFRPVE